jgi:hypothetical protein
MRRGGAKVKGNAHERKIAKLLSIWYYGDENALIRAPSSGSVATFRMDKGMPCGDIMQVKFPESPFPFSCESKNYKCADLIELLDCNKGSILLKSWRQTINECGKDKFPLMVFTANYKSTLAFMPKHCANKLLVEMSINLLEWKNGGPDPIVIFLFSDLLKCDPNRLKDNPDGQEKALVDIG